ncbi:MAG: hypothetical protein GWO07_02770 [Candidatus Dadabacteria bacterium]|nr:hypothetical protein [Candidatus Dadabacteria bacterium]NIS07690.1 hypothetical protein [Candidatus Dadabacteria bacterium]NIV42269.1 hypothetical protein [Candidatus Dadabacteria bacterium]NIX14776.1 hypothetical protein [Candidatus Dadabacteria bacterium]NIY21317.1 hypothetical protein [Candidatus Dadabacteria bacterium]
MSDTDKKTEITNLLVQFVKANRKEAIVAKLIGRLASQRLEISHLQMLLVQKGILTESELDKSQLMDKDAIENMMLDYIRNMLKEEM